MTPGEERGLLETRRRIEANLDRLARLSVSGMEIRAYFAELLQLVAPSITARGGAVWLNEGKEPLILASLDYETSGASPGSRQENDIGRLVSQCLAENRTLVVLPALEKTSPIETNRVSADAPPLNTAPYPFFYVPVLLEGKPAAALQFWLQSTADPIHYKDYAAFLGTVAGHATIFLHQQQSTRHRSIASSLQMQSRFHQDLFSCHGTKDVLEVSANYMADLADAELGFACRRKGRSWKLVAASNADRVVAASSQALLLAAAVDSLPRDKLVIVDGSDKNTPEPVRHALNQCGASLIIGSFASEKDGVAPRIFLGALRQNQSAPNQDITNSVAAAAYAAARLFHEKEIREARPFSGIFHAAARTRLLWHEHPRRILLTGAAMVAALLLILFLPWSWKVTADCTVLPAHRLSAVAGTDGKLLEVMVGEGDLVNAGQVIARIDDRDLRSELAAAEQERQRWRVEAASAQAAGNDADRKVAELNELREEESMKLLGYRLARTEITSPMNGVILTRELRNQEGQNMETGKVLCEVADPTAYLLELQIRQQDLGEVQTALSDDQPHRIDFILHSHSDRKLHAEVQGLASLSPAAELGPKGSYFILRTQFPGGEISIQDLKTGYTGKAKITLGTRPLWRVLFTPFLNYINMEWGV